MKFKVGDRVIVRHPNNKFFYMDGHTGTVIEEDRILDICGYKIKFDKPVKTKEDFHDNYTNFLYVSEHRLEAL